MDAFIPACASVLITLIIFGFFAYLRYMRHRETLALIDKGLVKPPRGNGRDTLRWGIAFTALGGALCVGLYPIGWVASPGSFPLNFGPWMLAGLIPTFFGLALLLIYALTRKEENKGAGTSEERRPEGSESARTRGDGTPPLSEQRTPAPPPPDTAPSPE